jgi:Mrp family chromosome partitioning ATPase
MSGYLGMDLPGFIALVRSRARLIAGIVAAAMVLALFASLLQSSKYRATADLLFGPSPAAEALDSGLGDTSDDIPERVAATNLALASLDGVAARVKQQLGTPASVEDLKAAVEVQTAGDSDIGTVTAEWDSAAGAAEVANAFAAQIVATRAEAARTDLQRAIDALGGVLAAQPTDAPPASTRALRDRISTLQALAAVDSGGVRVVEPATPPPDRSSPTPLRNAVIAGFLALVLALLLIVVLARVDDRVADEDELTALVRAPVLARVPVLSRQDAAPHDPFEFLRLNLQLVRPRDGGVAYVITSARPGDGKTLVASRLARALGASGAEVVLVDHDVRKPDLDRHVNPFEEPAAGKPPEPPREEAPEMPANGRRAYSDEDIEAALTELALCDGNARRAARALKASGLDVSESTLRRWKAVHALQYAELRTAWSGTAAAYIAQATLQPGVRLLTVADEPALAAMPSDRERLRRLFAELKARADYVLVDTVPVTAAADASAVAAEADGVILVVDLERLRTRDLAATTRQLANARAEILGVVINRSTVDHQAYPPPANGAGSFARQLADGSRATLRRVQSESSARLASLIRRDEPRE